jgi:hypothetical protein
MIKQALLLFSLFIVSISMSHASSLTLQSDYSIIPTVKETIVSLVVKEKTSVESYSYIKEISLSAISFIQSDGNNTTDELESLIKTVSVRLEKRAIFMKRSDIVETIISAINS